MTVASSIGGGNNRWLGCVVGLILLWLGGITIKLMHHGQGSIVCNSLLIPCTMNFYFLFLPFIYYHHDQL